MKSETKHTKRVKKLIGVCAMCAVIMTASTYAWFVGMKTVNVAGFDIKIATTEGLFLSMDGKTWSYSLDAKNAVAYVGNTNSWAEDGLVPMSTVGDVDSTSSTMKLYEKGSLTATGGGARLLTSLVENHTADESGKYQEDRGYVAFDLFIKNISGRAYYDGNEPLNEEAIYLTTNSKVEVSNNGGEVGTGIENSVRVAFTQIGRVKGDTGAESVNNITNISCSDVEAAEGQVQVTGICRSAQIWEPNDTKHVQNAINWYSTSCSPRKPAGLHTYESTSYGEYDSVTSCGTVENDKYSPTYAISRVLGVDDNVDIYDGQAYNTYTSNTVSYSNYEAGVSKLVEFPYFTDTMKNKTSTERPTFMTLAPNSITKVRVYVYIEGQDIDNYDFASLGKMISVNFGFTKERYTEEDINYVGPSTDITPTATN